MGSLREKITAIGSGEKQADAVGGSMFEYPDTVLSRKETDLLEDLLGRMLRYKPEERISMEEVVAHPWFDCK